MYTAMLCGPSGALAMRSLPISIESPSLPNFQSAVAGGIRPFRRRAGCSARTGHRSSHARFSREVCCGPKGGLEVAGKLSGKTAIVTGAASGIGRASAIQLASDGARVACADLNGEGAESVAKEITRAGGEAFGLRLDVSDPADNERAVAAVLKRFGGLQ